MAKQTNSRIYHTTELGLIRKRTKREDLEEKQFIKLDLKLNRVLVYSYPVFKTLFLKRFLVTSALKYPEDFNQKLLTELFGEGILS